MTHSTSPDDREFVAAFEACRIAPDDFDHRAHIRLAYAYLTERDSDAATTSIRAALRRFLKHVGAPATKYHETLTRAWVLAVRHFMARTRPCASSDAFFAANPLLLDSRIMLTHYSRDRLFSDAARERFVTPDLDAIPLA